jgi:patatin-like phospholipase/acyl hydrolase
MSTIHILSLDGGGILGIIPLYILMHIEQQTGKPIAKLFHLIGGVSTGGIIALGLSKPKDLASKDPHYSAENLLQLYKTKAMCIFKRTLLASLCNLTSFGHIHDLFFCKYTAVGAESIFDGFLGNCKLSQAVIPILIPAYNIKGHFFKEPRIKVFSSHKSLCRQKPGYDDFLMKDIALATSAAPTYFPPKHLMNYKKRSLCLIDGGVAVNDPALLAYYEARSIFPKKKVVIFSLGIGNDVYDYHSIISQKSPGLWRWRKKLAKLITAPQSSVYRAIMQKLSHQKNFNYLRIQAFLDPLSFDDASPRYIKFLEEKAIEIIQSSKKKIDYIIDLIK